MATTFEKKMQEAIDSRLLPGAVLVAGDDQGKFRYEKAFGYRSLKDPSHPDPMQLDATMWMASCTKLVTTIAVMQCVERGLLNLDEDVTGILPELKDLPILTGFEEVDGKDKPILVENTKPITLRHLLTHSSGLTYDYFNPMLMRYRATQNIVPKLASHSTLVDAFVLPLLFAPGESWVYGVGIDWAGWMVERVNGNLSLEEYIRQNILAPLGVANFSFFPKSMPSLMSRMTDMTTREGGINKFGTTANPEGKVAHTDEVFWKQPRECSGGGGGYGSPLEYHKILQSILVDDEKLLRKDTVAAMFKPQLSSPSREQLMALLEIPEVNATFGGYPPGAKVDFGLGGLLLLEDVAGRKKGTMNWGGYPNLLWFVDRVAGMSAIYGSQITPPGDPKTNKLFAKWVEEIYENTGKQESKL